MAQICVLRMVEIESSEYNRDEIPVCFGTGIIFLLAQSNALALLDSTHNIRDVNLTFTKETFQIRKHVELQMQILLLCRQICVRAATTPC